MNALGRIAREWMGNTIARKREFDAVTGSLERQTAGPSNNETALQNESFGYDVAGNLQQRQNSLGSLPAALSEDFTNIDDNLYRFKTGTVRANGAITATYNVTQYDDIGNIQHVDATGTIPAPVDQTISWTSYNYPKTITAPWQNESVSFAYGPDRDRWRMVYTAGAATETTYYLGGLMEKVITASGATEYRHYIPGPEEIIGIHTRSGSNATTRYLLTDHPGSVDTIFDSAGAKIVNESFTAYGLPRNPDTWSGKVANSGDAITRQGYTFQTVLGRMGLNHMNGRVQDAMTGSFLSPDPFVPDPSDTQSFNRYAYVRNNPLTYVDPSGFIDFNSNQGCDGCMFGMVGEVGSSGPGISYDVIQFYGDFNSYLGAMGITALDGEPCRNTEEFCWREYNQQLQQPNTPPAIQISWSRMENVGGGLGSLLVAQLREAAFGTPSTAESFVPIWGSARSAAHDFHEGSWGWGSFNAALAITDIAFTKSAVEAFGKGAWKTGSHTWKATRAWLGRQGFAAKWQHVDHALVPRRWFEGTWWEAVFNQKWNLKALTPPEGISMDAWHRMLDGRDEGLRWIERWWHRTPSWVKWGEGSAAGHTASAEESENDNE